MDLSDQDHDKKVEDARNLLESVTLLETVASEREGKAEDLIESLNDEGMPPEELADRLDISERSVGMMLDRNEPNPPHERMGVSESSVERLDPLQDRAGPDTA